MFRKLVLVLGLCAILTACGSEAPDVRVISMPPQVLVQQTPNIPLPQPTNNFVIVQRGFYANCRGYITGVFYSYPYGRVYNINPLTCGCRVYYNVQIAEGFLR